MPGYSALEPDYQKVVNNQSKKFYDSYFKMFPHAKNKSPKKKGRQNRGK